MRGAVAMGLLSVVILVSAQPISDGLEASLAKAELNEDGEFSNPIGDLDKGGLMSGCPLCSGVLVLTFDQAMAPPSGYQTMAARCAPTLPT